MSSKANQRRQLRRLTEEEGRPPIRGELLLLSHQYHHHEEEDEDFPPLHSPAAAEETFVSGPAGGDHQETEGCMSSYTVTPKRGAYPSDWDDELDDHLTQEDHTPLNYDFDDDDDVLVPYVFGRSRSASAIRHQRPQPPSELNADAAPFVPNPGVTANVVGYLDGSTSSHHQPIPVTRSAQPSPQASNNALLQYNPNATTLYGSVSSPSYQRRGAGGGHHSTTSGGGTQLFSFHHSSSSERAPASHMNVAPLGSSTSSSSSAAGPKWSSHSLVKLKQSWLNALLADIANPLTINSVVDFLVRPPMPPPEQQKLRNCRGSATSPQLGFRHPLSYFLIPMPRLRYIHPSINELAIRKLRFNSQVVIKTKMAAREPTDTEERFILSPQGLPGLENAISADWMICILFCVYYLLPPLRQIVARHSCDVSTCWICELAFLYRMMDLAKGENRGIPCRADNFLSALFRVSQVKSLGLREDEMTFDDEVTYIHPSVGGVSPPQAIDISTAVVVGTGPYSDDHNDSSCLSCPVDDGSSAMLHHHARHYTTAHHPHHWSPFITPQVYPVWGDSPPPGNDGHHQNPPPTQILPPYPSSGSSGGATSEQSSYPPPPRLYFPTAGDLNRQHVLNTMRQLESEKQKILQSHEKRSQMHERFHRILFFLVHSLTKLSLTPDDTMSFTVNVLRRCACDCRSPIPKGSANGNIIRLPILDLNYDPWILRNHTSAAGSDHVASSSFADVLAGSLWNQKDSSAQPPYQCPTCHKRTFPQTMETQVLSPLPDILTIKCKLSSDSSTGVSLNSPASVGLSNQIVEFWRRGGCAMDFRDFDPPIGLADSKVFKMVGSMSGNEPLSVALRTEERLCNLFKRIVNDTVPTSTRASLVNSLRISRCNTILAPRITVRSRSDDDDEGSSARVLTLHECTVCGRAVSRVSAGAQDTSKDSNPWVVSEHTSSCPIGEGDEDMYELVGVVSSVGYVWSDIKSSFFRSLSESAVNLEEEWVNQPPTEGHMVAHLKIPQLEGETNSDDGIMWQWYSLNASVVTKATEHEALDFMPLWRYPCMLIYAKVSSVWNAEAFKIPEPPPLLHQCLYGSTNISQNTQMSNQIRTFTPLFADEISNIKQGNFMVGLDAEHVVSQLFKKPGVRIPHPILSLGRISMLRAGGSLEGVPFIDHYVLSKKEPVDYRTAYSGLKQGDLNLNSPYFLTTHKYVYQVLRCLIHYGCCFVGHDLFNDFRVINIFVPTSLIVDTVELFRLSSSSRLLSLKFLAFHVLNMRVQQNIHDSIEDSRCALALYKEYIKYLVSNDEEGFKNVVSNLYVTGYRDNFKLFDE